MRWPVFVFTGFLCLVLDVSVSNVLEFSNIKPSFVSVLLVFVSLFAPRPAALWACWSLGLLVDLNTSLMHGPKGAGPLLGAYALGYCFGGILVLQVRSMLFRRRALTMGVTTVFFVLATSLVVVAIYAVHGWYPGEELHWAEVGSTGELLRRLGIAGYTGLLGLVAGRLLIWSLPMWGFRAPAQRAAAWR